jgi:hypothetical protein
VKPAKAPYYFITHKNSPYFACTPYFYFVKMFFLLFPALPQAGGLKEISRWLSEAWRATPPVMDKK